MASPSGAPFRCAASNKPTKVQKFCAYDLRNAKLTQLAEHPTSTSRALGSGTGLEDLLAVEARTLLLAAASGIPVEPEGMRAFARACLEVSEVGRLALAVLDGGLFAPRRALELAKTVTDAVGARPAASRLEA